MQAGRFHTLYLISQPSNRGWSLDLCRSLVMMVKIDHPGSCDPWLFTAPLVLLTVLFLLLARPHSSLHTRWSPARSPCLCGRLVPSLPSFPLTVLPLLLTPQVDAGVLPMFRAAAAQFLSEAASPEDALAAALAKITGHTQMRARSLLTAHEGFTTLLFAAAGWAVEKPGYVFSFLRRKMTEEVCSVGAKGLRSGGGLWAQLVVERQPGGSERET